MRPAQDKQHPERKYSERESLEKKYLVEWRCEECKGSFTTVVTGLQVDKWAPEDLPKIPLCPRCGKERVFYRGNEEVSTAAAPEGGAAEERQATHTSEDRSSNGEAPS